MEHLRSVSFNEHRCIRRDLLALYGHIVATATYTGPARLTRSMLYEALKFCVAEHAMLSTVVQRAASPVPQLARISTIDLNKHVRWYDESRDDDGKNASLHDRLMEIHHASLSDYESTPQWRVWVFPVSGSSSSSLSEPSFCMAFTCSHALADGMSLFTFHQTFLRALSISKLGEAPAVDGIYQVPPKTILPPGLDHVAKLPFSWSLSFRLAVSEYLPQSIANILGWNDNEPPDIWLGAPERPSRPASGEVLPTELEILCIPAARLQRSLLVCRDHGARLTALLNHLFSRALAHTLRELGKNYTTFSVETSINLRKCIPEGVNQIANYASAIEQTHDVSANCDSTAPLGPEDWATIRQHTQELEQMSNTLIDQPIAHLKHIPDFEPWLLERVQGTATSSVGTSNLGVFPENRVSGNAWKITEMLFSQPADGTTAVFNINLATVRDGALGITVTWWSGMLGVVNERRFVRDVLTAVERQMDAL